MNNGITQKQSAELMNALVTTGIFVTCGRETPNIMVAHWGTMGKLWGRDVFSLPIRSTKYSYRIVSKTKSFALNVPARDMRTEISLCDTVSGFKCNKFETLNLLPKRARSIDAYVLAECGLIVECEVLAVIPPENIEPQVDGLFTSARPHTLFVGAVKDCYKQK